MFEMKFRQPFKNSELERNNQADHHAYNFKFNVLHATLICVYASHGGDVVNNENLNSNFS